ncbi:MAG: SRPBCC family protein [Solirubrobacteraceae bacterium]
MKLEQSFEVDAPLERVWQTLIDVEHVAPCLPGAAVTGRNDDGSYNGTFTVKIGPTTASYTGRLEMENVDEASHTATMQAQGTDKRGQGGAKATIHSRLAPVNGRGTKVEVVTDYHITGRLARFGRGGMIEDISERLLREFAKRLQSSLISQQDTIVSSAHEPAAAPPEPVVASGEPEAPVAPVAPVGGTEEATRDHTVFAPVPTESTPPEAPVSPAGDVTPPPPPPSEPIAPPQPPAPVAEPSPVADAGATAPPEPPAPPPPPSPGPPPVATPPPAPSAPPIGQRPPLEHPPQPSEPMQGLSLVGGVVWNRVKRNPAPAAAAGVAVMLLLARRRRRRR